MPILTEQQARQSPVCIGCNQRKETGLIVCWSCFKHHCPTNPVPLKYSGLSFADWQRGKTLNPLTGGRK
jgi:hypothetical protein